LLFTVRLMALDDTGGNVLSATVQGEPRPARADHRRPA